MFVFRAVMVSNMKRMRELREGKGRSEADREAGRQAESGGAERREKGWGRGGG